MTELNLGLLFIGGLALCFGLVSGLVKNRVYPLSEPLAAVLLGVLIGPVGLNLVRLDWGDPLLILEQVARLTIAVSVMSIALRLPKGYFQQNWRSLATLLGPGMLFMWGVSGLLAYALLGVPFWVGMLIGAVVTPTDPVISGTIVTGKLAEENIPARLRHSLSAESGANDGGAYPFVFLALLLLEQPTGAALQTWLTRVLLWEVGAAVLLGLAIGYVAGKVQQWSETRGYLEQTSLLTITVALSVTTLAAVKLLGSDGILAVFAAGLAFNRLAEPGEEMKEQQVQEVVNRLFTFPVFTFFGMALPWQDWETLGWTGVALALCVLLLRRPPMMVALSPALEPLQKRADVLFNGWFGPIGVAAIFYATLAVRETGLQEVWVVGSLVVTASIIAHGVTATPLTKLYGRRTR